MGTTENQNGPSEGNDDSGSLNWEDLENVLMEGIEDIMNAITGGAPTRGDPTEGEPTGGDPTGGDPIPENSVETGSGADDLLSGIANALSGEA